MPADLPATDLLAQIRQWAAELGFQQIGVTSVDLRQDEQWLARWLELGRHGRMDYMERHGLRRARPHELVPGTIRVISVRMDYLPPDARDAEEVMADPQLGFISRYALGRDYHKLMRKRLAQLARLITASTNSPSPHIKTVSTNSPSPASSGGRQGMGASDSEDSQASEAPAYRVFVDSAPILEKALARNAGLGWIGKHTNLINRNAGSWFFLGEILTDIPLPMNEPATAHCGTCRACIDVCPTQAIVAPYELDAKRCISYLTIELRESIPVEFRKAMGNRIYGCDDCQLVCPWNKFAQMTREADFTVRNQLDAPRLIELFAWTEEEFLTRTEGSAIRRIGHECWLRNVAIALGNAPTSAEILNALMSRRTHSSALVREHVEWAIAQHAPTQSSGERKLESGSPSAATTS